LTADLDHALEVFAKAARIHGLVDPR
jgi:hypothetical protein